jgi:hypothetical protein
LADRVVLDVGAAAAWPGVADVLIVNGASQVWGGEPAEHTANALTAGRKLLRSGGRLLLGEGVLATGTDFSPPVTGITKFTSLTS